MNIMLIKIEANESALCSECGGACCNRSPGCVFPQDLSPIFDVKEIRRKLEGMLRSHYCLDFWEGRSQIEDVIGEDQIAYFVRPRIKFARDRLIDPSWGGPCSLLTDRGCELKFEDRPSECKSLTPSETFRTTGCIGDNRFDKLSSVRAWAPFNDVIEEVLQRIRGER